MTNTSMRTTRTTHHHQVKDKISSLHILGCGSIGLLFASSIRRKFPKKDVRMLLRPHHRHRLQYKRNTNTTFNNVTTQNNELFIHCCYQSFTKDFDNINDTRNDHKSFVSIPAELISSSNENKINNHHHDDTTIINSLLLCTKAHDAYSAISSISHRLSHTSKIVILSNGALAIRDQLEKQLSLFGNHLSRPTLILASTTHGAYRPDLTTNTNTTSVTKNRGDKPNQNDTLYHVVHAGVGNVYVHDQEIANIFQACGLNGKYVTKAQMNIILWKKLAANCVVNPLTALHRITNGQLLPQKEWHLHKTNSISFNDGFLTRIHKIIQEVASVANAVELEFEGESKEKCDKERYDNHIVTHNKSPSPLSYEELGAFVHSVMVQTSNNKSSMLQDVLSHARKTEINYLNGYICQLGKIHGIPTPENERLCQEIQNLVQR